MTSDAQLPPNLIQHLRDVLVDLSEHPYPFVVNPPTTPKRASVALIIRISPDYAHWPPSRDQEPEIVEYQNPKEQLDTFFAQEWVQFGDPEVLFIKRSSRKSDKWSSHIALPGGRRDPEDNDDKAAAVRESLEEVGIDVEKGAIAAGNLAQRVVTTSWGKTALMVLCPYVFLLKRHDVPPLRLQPTEVASAHWVSLRALLSPTQRTVVSIDIAMRYAKDVRRWHKRLLLGDMMFAAVRLVPSESVYSTAQEGFIPARAEKASAISRLRSWLKSSPVPAPSLDQPLHLWGLTLGVVADFLDLLPPHDAIRLWIYPTFTAYDVQFILWALSYRFRAQKAKLLERGVSNRGGTITLEEGVQATHMHSESFASPCLTLDVDAPSHGETGIEGLGIGEGRKSGRAVGHPRGSRSEAVGSLLEGYYDYIRRSVKVTILGRGAVAVGIVAFYIWRWRKKRRL